MQGDYSANKMLAYCKAMIGEDSQPESVAFAFLLRCCDRHVGVGITVLA
jgi:hypothetical protein